MTNIEKKAIAYLKYRRENEYYTRILMNTETWTYIVRFTVDEHIFSSFGEMFIFLAACYDDEVEAGNIDTYFMVGGYHRGRKNEH